MEPICRIKIVFNDGLNALLVTVVRCLEHKENCKGQMTERVW